MDTRTYTDAKGFPLQVGQRITASRRKGQRDSGIIVSIEPRDDGDPAVSFRCFKTHGLRHFRASNVRVQRGTWATQEAKRYKALRAACPKPRPLPKRRKK